MEHDPAYQRTENAFHDEELDRQLAAILKRYDADGDGKLNRQELNLLRIHIETFSNAEPEWLVGRKVLVAPLLSKQFPTVEAILNTYDTNHDGALDATELKALAHAVQKP
jgi:Ca2+-binding EF-hand superfamily protein